MQRIYQSLFYLDWYSFSLVIKHEGHFETLPELGVPGKNSSLITYYIAIRNTGLLMPALRKKL